LASGVGRHAEFGDRSAWLMVRWMCGASLKNRIASKELNERMAVVCVADVVRKGGLRWFGHFEHKKRMNLRLHCDRHKK